MIRWGIQRHRCPNVQRSFYGLKSMRGPSTGLPTPRVRTGSTCMALRPMWGPGTKAASSRLGACVDSIVVHHARAA